MSITIPQSRLRRDSSLYTREPLKIPTANFCWQWGMCARENIFVSLKAKPVLSPYRARANYPLYGWLCLWGVIFSGRFRRRSF